MQEMMGWQLSDLLADNREMYPFTTMLCSETIGVEAFLQLALLMC